MKHTRRRRRSVKGFYIAAAMILLATGGIARISVDRAEKTDEPKNINSSESSITQSIVSDTASNLTVTPSQQTDLADNTDNTSTVTESQNGSKQEVTEQAATTKVLTFAMPIRDTIIKQFSTDGLIYSKTYGDMRAHTGIDIVAEEGATVKSSAEGTVKEINEDSLWGNTVIIEHGDGLLSYYCGLNDVTVKVGDKVTMSSIVGTVGEVPCECLDEMHLHFAIKDDSGWLSPLEVMGLQ